MRELVPVARDRFGATPCSVWPCFHTVLFRVEREGINTGLIGGGGTVGAPFAVLVAEQLIALGCRHIIGYSSSGAVSDRLVLPCLVVPDRALRDEGTSYHYLPPAKWAHSRVNSRISQLAMRPFAGCRCTGGGLGRPTLLIARRDWKSSGIAQKASSRWKWKPPR